VMKSRPEVEVALQRHADEIGHRILCFFRQLFGAGLTAAADNPKTKERTLSSPKSSRVLMVTMSCPLADRGALSGVRFRVKDGTPDPDT
jgi:hypothetical protein